MRGRRACDLAFLCNSAHTLTSRGETPIPAEFIVKVGANPQKVVVEFATTVSDLSFVEKWRETLGTNPEPKQRDAADFAVLARERFIADSKVGQSYLRTTDDLRDQIDRDPECEVGGLILLKCDWFAHSGSIGLCHFRRTWCNNIIVDYLATHPLTLSGAKDAPYNVKGIGTALLCFVSRLAIEASCEVVWGEATVISHTFYEYLFKVKAVKDLFVIPRENFALCAGKELDWQTKKDVNTMNMENVQELYDVEEKHPPLVGNRTQMVGSRRQLIHHFLDLPRYTQDEIAQTLGLLKDGDSEILEDQWCGVLFQRADEGGKLRELWDEIEKRHENGEPEKNPFVR